MPVILCYGDSNTWGYDPKSAERLAPELRWTGVMARTLGAGYRVIEEGLGGRTTVREDPYEPFRNGLTYLTPCLLSHAPLDLVVISLGCNDLKSRFGVGAQDIARGAEILVATALSLDAGIAGKPPAVLLIAPPPLVELSGFSEMFAGGPEKSKHLGRHYAVVAAAHGVGFLDAGKHIHCSPLDGIHYEADQHDVLGQAIAGAVRQALGA